MFCANITVGAAMRLILPLLFLLSMLRPAEAKDVFLTPSGGQNIKTTSADNVESVTNAESALAVNDVVYLSGNGVAAKASATDTTKPAMGIVLEINSTTASKVITRGLITGFSSGMTAGQAYYLSETAGTLQTTAVTGEGKLGQYVGKAWNATDLLVEPQQPSFYAASGSFSGSLGSTDNVVPRADGVGGGTFQSSSLVVDDSGNLTGIGNITLSGTVDGVNISASPAALTAGTSANNLVQLNGSSQLPAVSGALLTNLPGGMGGTAGVVDNAVVRADGTGAATLQGSALVVDDSGNLTGIGNITLSGTVDGVDVSGLGSVYQPLDATLTSHAALDGTGGDKGIYFTAADTAATFTLTTTGRSILDDTSTGAVLTTIGAQPLNTNLTALGGLTSAANKLPYFTGSGTAAVTDYTTGSRATDALGWTAGTQVASLTGASTASLLTVGTGASNLVQLNASSRLPMGLHSSPADCTWTKSWVASDGLMGSNGFTLTNFGTETQAADSLGNTASSVTSTSAIGRVTYASSLPADGDSWEVELDFIPATGDGGSGIDVDPGSGERERMFLSSGVFNSASSTTWGSSARTDVTYRQVWTLVRHGGAWTYAYVNGVPVGFAPFSAGVAASAQRWCFLNCGASTATRTYKVYAIRIRSAGVCETPPHLRYYGLVRGP